MKPTFGKTLVLIVLWSIAICINYYISVKEPNDIILQAAKDKIESDQPLHQDTRLYTEVLFKIKSNQCEKTEDGKNNTFYKCSDGYTISQIEWIRKMNSDHPRKGIVTRYYNSTGKLLLIYGHPDDI